MKINYDESKVFIAGIVEVNSEEDQLTQKLEASGKSSTRLLYYWSVILVDERHLGDQTTIEDKISHVDVWND